MATNMGVNSATNSPSVGANTNRIQPGNTPQIAPTNQIIPRGNPANRMADIVQISPEARRAQNTAESGNRITGQTSDRTVTTNRVRVTTDRIQISEEARRAQEQQQAQETPPPPPENPEDATVDEMTA